MDPLLHFRETQEIFLEVCPNNSRKMPVLDALIEKHVHPGLKIIAPKHVH